VDENLKSFGKLDAKIIGLEMQILHWFKVVHLLAGSSSLQPPRAARYDINRRCTTALLFDCHVVAGLQKIVLQNGLSSIQDELYVSCMGLSLRAKIYAVVLYHWLQLGTVQQVEYRLATCLTKERSRCCAILIRRDKPGGVQHETIRVGLVTTVQHSTKLPALIIQPVSLKIVCYIMVHSNSAARQRSFFVVWIQRLDCMLRRCEETCNGAVPIHEILYKGMTGCMQGETMKSKLETVNK
jgi:hypothetical protein